MTIGFSLLFPKSQDPTFFKHKITECLIQENVFTDKLVIDYQTQLPCGYTAAHGAVKPKKHTIREDATNRWGKGCIIHAVHHNRTKKRYQFLPQFECTGIEEISIKYLLKIRPTPFVVVDIKLLTPDEVEKLAVNDGFEDSEAFYKYFHKDYEGKIIHWTKTRYGHRHIYEPLR